VTIQHPSDFEFETGLEDFDMSDAVIPRLTIAHRDGEFRDSLSNEQFPKLTTIMLGLVKQRVLWHPDIDDGDWPMCRSADHDTGFPNMNESQPMDKRFPWEKAGFDPADYPPGADGQIRLPCAGCTLKEWKSHPDGKRPYCSEQFTIPMLYDPRQDGNWVPAVFSFQKTALKPLKSYLTSFARSKNAAFQAITEIGLDMMKRGTTEYAVPNFRRVGDTNEEEWRGYSTSFRTMKDFLTADPGSREEAEPTAPSVQQNNRPAEEKKKDEDVVEAQIVEDAAGDSAPAADDDDDLPF
jgi:hypothetical protein